MYDVQSDKHSPMYMEEKKYISINICWLGNNIYVHKVEYKNLKFSL